MRCPACGQENPEGFRFCGKCGAPLGPVAGPAREERKIVTVLFADLVGFTARAETMDPEDVRALLAPYHARLRQELERFGGTVEKFIGDAVMALFGAPVAHEDDPERAVRAALAIREWVRDQEEELQLRIAVNTGEALVNLHARPEAGEGMASGDVVNTTARLQAAAPVNGILVGETTYRATRHVVDYSEHAAVEAKGKAAPIAVWEAVQLRARIDVDKHDEAPLVGRREELESLLNALGRVRREATSQLVTLVGEPGIGKSRLVYELFKTIESGEELTYWRRGRSLPYGEGVTFWALGEIVKAHAGILESDDVAAAEHKLAQAVADLIAGDSEAAWVVAHLRPLVGVTTETGSAGDRREESFTAWRRFCEAIAERHPLVLVFEDLHWADDDLLEFVDHLVEWSSGVALLVVATARPELLDRRPGWGGGKRNAVTISLAPLSDGETARLIGALLDRPVVPAETQSMLLARAGGNPLYAEQYAHMLSERGEDEPAMPESIQGIIAGRLDLLATEEKRLLQDAAVLGKVFWSGALIALDDRDRREVEQALHALERKEFVHPSRRSSVEDEREYTFRHLLVRDVAYGQIPRAVRAEKHLRAAEWIESLGRPEDHAEMVAHHYLASLELGQAAGETPKGLSERAVAALQDAGDRAFSLNAYGAAIRFYEGALRLWREEPLDLPRARLMFRLGRAMYVGETTGEEMLAQASAALADAGDPETGAEAELLLYDLYWNRGMRDVALERLNQAQSLVSELPPSRAKAYVTAARARFHALSGDEPEEAVRLGREALALAEVLGLDELRANALNTVGMMLAHFGGSDGIDELETSIEIAREANAPTELCRGLNNLASMILQSGDVVRAWELVQDFRTAAAQYGQTSYLRWSRQLELEHAYWSGRWSAAKETADECIGELQAGSPHYHGGQYHYFRALIRVAEDDVAGALEDAERGLELARLAKDSQIFLPSLCVCSYVRLVAGKPKQAEALAEELLDALRGGRVIAWECVMFPTFAWAAVGLSRGPALVDALPSGTPFRWVDVARAIGAGDFATAAEISAGMGARPEEAWARLHAAEAFVRQSRRPEADEQLQQALAFYRAVGATRYLREAEALLAAAS